MATQKSITRVRSLDATETASVKGPNSLHLSPNDHRVTNPMLRKIHNVSVVHSRKGWTRAEALDAIAAAARGEVL